MRATSSARRWSPCAWPGRREASLTFTGDLGRRGSPLLRDPAPVPPADLLISESTYGGRVLEPPERAGDALEAVVRRTVERGGKVLIPAFSLGRTQVVLYYLEDAIRAGRLPAVPIFVDSSLAADIAAVYRRHPECLREGYRTRCLSEAPLAQYLRSVPEGTAVSTQRQPCVIISPSGMCDGGRIVRHLKNNLDDPRCSVVLVSYQAPHTLGRKLLVPRGRIRIHGRDWNFWADVVELPGFSGHPDQTELLSFLGPLAGQCPRVRLVHGEPEQAETLARALRRKGSATWPCPAAAKQYAWCDSWIATVQGEECQACRSAVRWSSPPCCSRAAWRALAWGVGWLASQPPLATFAWNARAAALGIAASLPLLALFALCVRWPVGPLARIQHFSDEVIRPWFAPCTLLDLAAISVAAGVGEEMLFRGFLQPLLGYYLGVWPALLAASVLFGLLHLITLTYALLAALIGVYLGYVQLFGDNLLAVIVAHALYDFVALVYLVRGPLAR